MTDPRNDAYDKINGGKPMSYEETADMFFATMTGKSTGVTRDQFMQALLLKFPTLEALNASLRDADIKYKLLMAQPQGPMQ